MRISDWSSDVCSSDLQVLQTLIAMYNAQIWPCIPCQGSVGASGDLAPLAHLSLAAMGEGSVRVGGEILEAADALRRADIEPIRLAEIGRAHVGTPVTNVHRVCRLSLEKKTKNIH